MTYPFQGDGGGGWEEATVLRPGDGCLIVLALSSTYDSSEVTNELPVMKWGAVPPFYPVQGQFSISLLRLSELKAKPLSEPSYLLQTGLLSCVQASDLGDILTWDCSLL